MRPIILGFGVALTVISLILMPFFYPLLDVDSAEEAAARAKEDEFATGLELRFKGRISGVSESPLFPEKKTISVEGFEGTFGSIVVVASDEGFHEGEEILVEGRYYGIFGIGFVAGEKNEETGEYEPASIERIPTPLFWLAVVVFACGLIVCAVGYIKI
ncbi:MAG: hypothetical protein ACE5KV_01385 [Thermoplasmata archaeon]